MMFRLYFEYKNNKGNGSLDTNGKINKRRKRKLKEHNRRELYVKKGEIMKRLDETSGKFKIYVMNQEGNFIDDDIAYETINNLQSQFYRTMDRAEELNGCLHKEDRINLKLYHKTKEEIGDILEERIKSYIAGECREMRSGETEEQLMKRMGKKKKEWYPPIIENSHYGLETLSTDYVPKNKKDI